jgi:hypothetical protein
MNFDTQKFKIWNWKNIVMFHWFINPGLAFNELILGQTLPKVILIEQNRNKPFWQRGRVPCPYCKTIHNSLKWSAQNKTAFKNWFGYYCDNCGKIIPVLRNLTSLAILLVTSPIWLWFIKPMKRKWLEKQPQRFINQNLEYDDELNTTKHWIVSGLIWGLFMFVFISIAVPLLSGDEITIKSILVGFIVGIFGGTAWGYTMKIWMNKMGKN